VHRKIIVGYDGSDQARDALALGRSLAKSTSATLLLAHVFRHDIPIAPGWQQHIDAVRAGAEKQLAEATRTLVDLDVETQAVGSSSAAWGLQDLAESEHADVIVLGSSHRGRVGRVFMGSVSDRLFHGSPCAVAVAPRGFSQRSDSALRVIGVAFDGSPESESALVEAARLAEAAGATLRVLAVAESNIYFGYSVGTYSQPEIFQWTKDHLEEVIATALETLPRKLKASGEVLSGDAAETLVSRTEGGVDLLVMGSRGYGPARRVLLGSVSAKLARSATCPLLVVPRTVENAAESEPEAVTAHGAV
jgi:nucleotide-binding universal stress UspA family protein